MLPRLHLVTDDAVLHDPSFATAAEGVLAVCGPDLALHVRGPCTAGAELHAIAQRLSGAALRAGAWLLVNDRVDIAMAMRANGVQLGVRSLAVADARALLGTHAAIGYSAHSPAEAAEAAALGASWIIAGSVWETSSHPGRAPAGAGMLAECVSRCSAPVIAIGGVTPSRLEEVHAAGAWGGAVLGGVWHAAQPAEAARGYVEWVRELWGSRES